MKNALSRICYKEIFMKLIHCADIHLDAPLESVFPPEGAREYRRAVLSDFSALVESADRNGADALLIAGDLFDSDNTSERTVRHVLDLFRAHPNLSVFYLAGNHDGGGLTARSDLPGNLHTFGQDWTYFDFGEVMIAGGTAPDPAALSLPPERVNVVLLHGQVRGGGKGGEYSISFSKLKNKNIDYLALGHLHTYREATLDARGIACYSGCLMGRGFDECGRKGYVLLETVNSRVNHTFVPFASRVFHEIPFDVSGYASCPELESALRKETGNILKTDFCRLVLKGQVDPECPPDIRQLQTDLAGSFALLRIRDETTLRIDPRDYENDISLKGEFIRRVLASEQDSAEQERIIACGLRALRGEEPEI